MRSSHLALAELIKLVMWSLTVVPFIVATTLSPLHFIGMVTDAAAHPTTSGDAIVGWISDSYDFVPPIHMIFRSSEQLHNIRVGRSQAVPHRQGGNKACR